MRAGGDTALASNHASIFGRQFSLHGSSPHSIFAAGRLVGPGFRVCWNHISTHGVVLVQAPQSLPSKAFSLHVASAGPTVAHCSVAAAASLPLDMLHDVSPVHLPFAECTRYSDASVSCLASTIHSCNWSFWDYGCDQSDAA